MLGVADMSDFYPQQENASGNTARKNQPASELLLAETAGVGRSTEQQALKADMQQQLKKFEKAVEERQRILDDSFNKQKSQFEKIVRVEREAGRSEADANKRATAKTSVHSDYLKIINKASQNEQMQRAMGQQNRCTIRLKNMDQKFRIQSAKLADLTQTNEPRQKVLVSSDQLGKMEGFTNSRLSTADTSQILK